MNRGRAAPQARIIFALVIRHSDVVHLQRFAACFFPRLSPSPRHAGSLFSSHRIALATEHSFNVYFAIIISKCRTVSHLPLFNLFFFSSFSFVLSFLFFLIRSLSSFLASLFAFVVFICHAKYYLNRSLKNFASYFFFFPLPSRYESTNIRIPEYNTRTVHVK